MSTIILNNNNNKKINIIITDGLNELFGLIICGIAASYDAEFDAFKDELFGLIICVITASYDEEFNAFKDGLLAEKKDEKKIIPKQIINSKTNHSKTKSKSKSKSYYNFTWIKCNPAHYPLTTPNTSQTPSYASPTPSNSPLKPLDSSPITGNYI